MYTIRSWVITYNRISVLSRCARHVLNLTPYKQRTVISDRSLESYIILVEKPKGFEMTMFCHKKSAKRQFYQLVTVLQ